MPAGLQPFGFTQFLSGSAQTPVSARASWYKMAAGIDYSYFSAGANTISIPLFLLQAGAAVQGVVIKHSTAFAGSGITGYTISVGTLALPAYFASAFNVFTPVSSTNFQISSNFAPLDFVNPSPVYVTAVSTGAVLSSANAGVVDIWAMLSQITP